MKDYTEESVLIAPTETLRGTDSIRGLFSEWFETLFRPGTYDLTLDRMEVEGDVAYIVWSSKNDGVDVTLGTDTYFVQEGKIVCQTFAARLDPK